MTNLNRVQEQQQYLDKTTDKVRTQSRVVNAVTLKQIRLLGKSEAELPVCLLSATLGARLRGHPARTCQLHV